MSSRATGRAPRRRGPGDDIPLARRSSPPPPPRRSVASRFRRTLLAAVAVAATSTALVVGPLRTWLTPPPVAGLKARLSADGRLLGHFPYPEVQAQLLVPIAPGLELRADAGEALQAMKRAAAADGIELVVVSGFRSISLQRHLFFDVGAERNQTPQARAQVSAPPGFSEHSTGYAVDLADGRRPDTNLSTSFDGTAAFAWLEANAARFHYQLSFPRNNRQGVSYEPWHWRYEGSTDALQLFEAAHRLAR